MTDRAQDVEAIFTEALEYTSSAERRAYVERACGGKPELQRRIRELLTAHEKTSGPLDTPPSPIVAPTIEHSHVEEVGTQIGPYKVLQVIGEGGMGIVCMAEQTEPVKRRVALKIIKPGMDSRQIIARFEAERQALAMMDHPNIARVFDAGSTDRGQPYFVMELVKGIPITEYCDQHKLSPKDRLALFIDVCQAVHHAHQKGIIHRDLKPSNVLVARFDDRPVVKVIDFGIAKATNQTLTERTMFTQFGQILGTLEYMSPEQAQFNQLDIDTRSDIYSLGVLLYELLTGQTPFDRNRLQTAALDEVLRIIREEEPPKPSVKLRSSAALSAMAEKRQLEPARLGSLIKGDLDWIVMKALEKDRTRRFGSAASFAQDVQRFLNSDPIESRPPSAGYRLRKMAWRHRVGLAMTLIAAIAVGATGLSVAFVQVSRRAEQATLYQLRQLLFDHGVTLIMNADSRGAGNIIKQLKDATADDFADKLQTIQMLHEDKPQAAVELLERLVQRNSQDAGLRAMLTDGYDQAGDIAKCVESFRKLKVLDTENLHPIEMVYAALAGIVEPAWGVKRAEEAVKKAPTSPYARLVRGRMTADYLHRAFDVQSDTSDAEKARSRALVDRAIGDIESLKFLYQYDRRTVALSLSTYLGAADIRRRLGDADWRDTVHLADDAVTFLEAHQPTAWDKFFLAAYYRELAQDEDVPERAWELYRAAAVDDKNDYHTAYFLALCHELRRKPPDELVTRVRGANSAFFGKFGLGRWYALNGEEDKAREQVNGLDRIQTVSSVTYAAMVLHLLRDEEMAAKLIEQYANTSAGREQLALNTGVITDLFEFFRAELTGPPEKQQAIRDNLLLEARGSEHPVTNRFLALWAIALRNWAEGDESEALRQFQTCADMRQAEFPEYIWSHAIVRRAAGSGAFSSDVTR